MKPFYVKLLYAGVTWLVYSVMFLLTNFTHLLFACGITKQGIFMLVAGFFRLIDDLPKPVWRYPLSYMGFDMYALQVQTILTLPRHMLLPEFEKRITELLL